MTPQLSVIIPTFRRPKLTCRAVRSVLRQREALDGHVEVMVVDDGSGDSTLRVLSEEFAQEIALQKVIVMAEAHLGDPAVMRNRAAARARGEFLGFLDSDDQWQDGRIGRLFAVFNSVDLVLCPEKWPESSVDWLRAYLEMNRGVLSSLVVRASLYRSVGGFSEAYYGVRRRLLRGWEDYEFILSCLLKLDEAGQLDRFRAMDIAQDILMDYQVDGIGRVQIREQMLREWLTLFRMSNRIPARVRGLWLKRILGASKAIVLGGG